MPMRLRGRRAAWVLLGFVLLPSWGCATDLRDSVAAGAYSFVTDATYGLLAEWLQTPLRGGTGTATDEDPFGDVPLQM